MNKILALLLALLTTFQVFAEDDPNDYRVLVTKTDGTVFVGYNNTRFTNYFRPKVKTVSISAEYKGEPTKYTGEEVRRIEFTGPVGESGPVIFEAVNAQSMLGHKWNKNPKPYDTPVFLRLIYEGENIKGYVMPYLDQTLTPGMNVMNYTWRYFYLTKDSDVAVSYWNDTNDIIPAVKKVMKFYFREFPAVVEMVDKGELKPKDFRKDPAMVLPLMDKTYKSKE